MSGGTQKASFSQREISEGVDLPRLQSYFQQKYELDATQAELLVVSSCESLREFLAEANTILATGDRSLDYEDISGIVHRAKGLFLIMGMENWAEYVVSLKISRTGAVYDNLKIVVVNIQKNFTDIIMLCGE